MAETPCESTHHRVSAVAQAADEGSGAVAQDAFRSLHELRVVADQQGPTAAPTRKVKKRKSG